MQEKNSTSNGPAGYMQTKRMINLSNSSDEYHSANDESFTTISTGQQQQQSVVAATPPTTLAARKQLSPADPNEPTKPLSAYALFFRDTVSAIKQQNPNCTFQELSKIVSSMWEALDPVHKAVYNKKNEAAKNEYIKQMKIYRQQQPQQTAVASSDGGNAVQQQQHDQSATVTPNTKSTIFNTMNLNQTATTILNQNNVSAATTPNINNTTSVSAGGGDDQTQTVNDGGEVIQKCTRENCNKRAIVNPDWEDEYCSNECVVIHCRNVFNEWVQSNLEAKKQQQQQAGDIQQTPGANT